MEPMVIARLVQMAAPMAGERALVVAAGTGYGAALLAACGANVTALEEDPDLIALARTALPEAGARSVNLVSGPLTEGWPDGAPYDIILIEGAVRDIPEAIRRPVAGGRRPAGHGADRPWQHRQGGASRSARRSASMRSRCSIAPRRSSRPSCPPRVSFSERKSAPETSRGQQSLGETPRSWQMRALSLGRLHAAIAARRNNDGGIVVRVRCGLTIAFGARGGVASSPPLQFSGSRALPKVRLRHSRAGRPPPSPATPPALGPRTLPEALGRLLLEQPAAPGGAGAASRYRRKRAPGARRLAADGRGCGQCGIWGRLFPPVSAIRDRRRAFSNSRTDRDIGTAQATLTQPLYQRRPDPGEHQPGREPGDRPARPADRAGADHLHRHGQRLCRRDPGAAVAHAQHQQRAGAVPAASGDQRPVPGRRDHPDRRGPGRGGACGRDGATRQTSEGNLATARGDLPAGHRRSPAGDLVEPQPLQGCRSAIEQEAGHARLLEQPERDRRRCSTMPRRKDAIDVAFSQLMPQVSLQGQTFQQNNSPLPHSTAERRPGPGDAFRAASTRAAPNTPRCGRRGRQEQQTRKHARRRAPPGDPAGDPVLGNAESPPARRSTARAPRSAPTRSPWRASSARRSSAAAPRRTC